MVGIAPRQAQMLVALKVDDIDSTRRVIRVEPCSGPGHLSRVAVAFAAHLSDDCLFQQVLRRRNLRAAQGGPA